MQQRCLQVEDWLWHNGLGRPIFSEWWHICNHCFFRFHEEILRVWNTDLITKCVFTLHWYIFWVNLNLDIEHFVWSRRDKNGYISDFCVCVIKCLWRLCLSVRQQVYRSFRSSIWHLSCFQSNQKFVFKIKSIPGDCLTDTLTVTNPGGSTPPGNFITI